MNDMLEDLEGALHTIREALQDSVDHFGCEEDVKALALLDKILEAVPDDLQEAMEAHQRRIGTSKWDALTDSPLAEVADLLATITKEPK